VGKNQITEKQLEKALERQRLHGGRLGDNLVALGFLSEEEVSSYFKRTPPAPRTMEGTKLQPSFIADLIMKHAVFMGEFTLPEMADRVKLPISVLDKAIDMLRKEHSLEVKSAGQISKLSFKFAITEQGKNRAADLLEISRYVGPAPVVFNEYRTMVETQTVKSILVSEDTVKDTFSHIIIRDELLKRLGPAVSSGRAIFLYGPPGNGKTTIAETIGKILPGAIYLPYAVLVGGEIITLYDKSNHIAVEPEHNADAVDQRWILVQRPVVMVGGELTLKSLELEFNAITKFHEAPLQMKANNGLFIVDDFGRQQVDPQKLLNRWIVPLERRTDFLTLHTGTKFEIPFDQLVVFSTNIEPKTLVDEAFLRRIHYKVKIDHPSFEEYGEIFKRVCDSNGMNFNKDTFDYLISNYYKELNVSLNACHPRDILDHIIDNAHYHGHPPDLTKEAVSYAWENYFVEL
jgi:predicted ATPase with chaperone activity